MAGNQSRNLFCQWDKKPILAYSVRTGGNLICVKIGINLCEKQILKDSLQLKCFFWGRASGVIVFGFFSGLKIVNFRMQKCRSRLSPFLERTRKIATISYRNSASISARRTSLSERFRSVFISPIDALPQLGERKRADARSATE